MNRQKRPRQLKYIQCCDQVAKLYFVHVCNLLFFDFTCQTKFPLHPLLSVSPPLPPFLLPSFFSSDMDKLVFHGYQPVTVYQAPVSNTSHLLFYYGWMRQSSRRRGSKKQVTQSERDLVLTVRSLIRRPSFTSVTGMQRT